jgi:putative chitinase
MIKLDRDIYFDSIRESLFGSMDQRQVDGQNFILDAWETHVSPNPLVNDLRWLSYFLATAYHETAQEMWPIEEYGKGQGHPYGERDPETGQIYYGRGFVMTTWRDNYKRADTEFGWEGEDSCEWHAELQLDPTVSAQTGFRGMVDGWFRSGEYLNKYFNDTADNPYGAREIINGDKHIVPSWSNGVSIGKLIEGYHDKFLEALEAAAIEETPKPEPEPEPEPEETTTVIRITGSDYTVEVDSSDDDEPIVG